MKILPFIVLGLLLMLNSGSAQAYSCSPLPIQEKIEQTDLIFKGIPEKSENSTDEMKDQYNKLKDPDARNKNDALPQVYTDFKVTKIYKGKTEEKARIFYDTGDKSFYKLPKTYETGKEVIIYAEKKNGFLLTFRGPCSSAGGGEQVLEEIKAGIDALNKLIADHPSVPEFYKKKVALLEKNKDFEQAADVYIQALKNAKGDGAKELTLGYGRALYETGQYEKALEILNPLKTDQGPAETFIQLSLIQLGRSAELNGQKLSLAGQNLQDISLNDLSIGGSDFSGAAINNVRFNKVNLQNSNFSGAQIRYIELDNVDASGANFDQARFEAKIKSSKFDNAKFTSEKIEVRDASDVSFKNADFTGAALYIRKSEKLNFTGAKFAQAKIDGLGNSITAGADFTGASFYGGYSSTQSQNLNLSGQQLDNSNFEGNDLTGSDFTDARLKNANFTGTILKGVNFKNADLTGARFNGAQHSKPTDLSGADLSTAKIDNALWNGAQYDCSTKFPQGFDPGNALMITSDMSCAPASAREMDYSWENLLQPPNKHYRILPQGSFAVFEGAKLADANFEGARMYLPQATDYGVRPGNTKSFPGKQVFRSADLKSANFRHTIGHMEFWGTDLEGADFSFSELETRMEDIDGKPVNLKNAKFYCANMNDFRTGKDSNIGEADLTAAVFNSANFQKWNSDWYKFNPIEKKILFRFMQKIIDQYGPADYSNMDFSRCDLMDIDFGTTNLSGAKFRGAHFYRTKFTQANLENTNFDAARFEDSSEFPADFDFSKHKIIPTAIINAGSSAWAASEGGMSSHHLHMGGSRRGPYDPPPLAVPDFPGEDLSKMDLKASWLMNSDMSKADISFSNFSASNLIGVNFSGAKARGAIFYDALLDNANLDGADFEGADFRHATLKGIKLEGANLKNALYDEKTVWSEGFDPIKAGMYLVPSAKKEE